jgi:hypothetical protein
VWGLWVEGVFYFGSGAPDVQGPQPRRESERRRAPGERRCGHHHCEGVAETVTDPALAEWIYAASTAKYEMGSLKTSRVPTPCAHASCSPGA